MSDDQDRCEWVNVSSGAFWFVNVTDMPIQVIVLYCTCSNECNLYRIFVTFLFVNVTYMLIQVIVLYVISVS